MSKSQLPKPHFVETGACAALGKPDEGPKPMQYSILFYETEAEFAKRQDPKAASDYWAAWGAYVEAVNQSGVMVSGAGLQPPAASTTLRLRDGKRHVQDGPYADTKEQLGGFFVIEAPDLDTALEWAAKSPAAGTGCVEVRPVLPPMR
jgi:hypothetical protein